MSKNVPRRFTFRQLKMPVFDIRVIREPKNGQHKGTIPIDAKLCAFRNLNALIGRFDRIFG